MMAVNASRACKCGLLNDISDLRKLWNRFDILMIPGFFGRRLAPGFACSEWALEEALRLRYSVFNVELGHGGGTAAGVNGLDRDEFDHQMTHLLLIEVTTRQIVGTYRVQTVEQALRRRGIYSAREFDMTGFGAYFKQAVECGRACIAPPYRKAISLMLLWGGLSAFVKMHRKRWMFGCCSISSQVEDDGWRTMKAIRAGGFLHEKLFLPAAPAYSCGNAERERAPDLGGPLPLPKLFGAYMRLGARVVSEPAVDRQFGTIDFLVLADLCKVNLANIELPDSGRTSI